MIVILCICVFGLGCFVGSILAACISASGRESDLQYIREDTLLKVRYIIQLSNASPESKDYILNVLDQNCDTHVETEEDDE